MFNIFERTKALILALCLVAYFGMFTANAQSQFGINTDTPKPSAVLDIVSSDKGVLIPRLSSIQRSTISSPDTGLIVYDITLQQIFYFDGASWLALLTIVNIADNDSTNEIQTLSFLGDSLSISDGNTIYLPIDSFWTKKTGDNYMYTTFERIGINTSNPLRVLHLSSSTDDFQLRMSHPSSTAFSYDIGRNVSGGKLHFYGNQSTWSGYQFEGVGGIYLTIEYDGDIGIGDDTPDGKLEVRQTSTGDIFNLYDNTTNVFTVEDGGNVGIGVTNPSDKLEVVGDVTITGNLTVTESEVSFLAYNSVNDAVSSGWNKVEFNVTKHNDGSDYSTTNDRFTAPTDGVYSFSSSVNISDMADSSR